MKLTPEEVKEVKHFRKLMKALGYSMPRVDLRVKDWYVMDWDEDELELTITLTKEKK